MNWEKIKAAIPARLKPRKLKERWWNRRLRSLALGWQLPSSYRARIANRAEWCVYNDLFVDGEYDRAIHATLDAVRDKSEATVLDLGANVGFFTLRFLDLWKRRGARPTRLHLNLIEGSPAVFRELSARAEEWRSAEVSLRLIHGLAGERAGAGLLKEETSHLASHVVKDVGQSGSAVGYVDLESLVPARQTINLLKCDIEGSEIALLQNYPALLARTERAVFEFHHWIRPASEMIAAVCAHGFGEPECQREMSDYSTWFFSRAETADAASPSRLS